jgi:hypothetical protein
MHTTAALICAADLCGAGCWMHNLHKMHNGMPQETAVKSLSVNDLRQDRTCRRFFHHAMQSTLRRGHRVNAATRRKRNHRPKRRMLIARSVGRLAGGLTAAVAADVEVALGGGVAGFAGEFGLRLAIDKCVHAVNGLRRGTAQQELRPPNWCYGSVRSSAAAWPVVDWFRIRAAGLAAVSGGP